MNPVELWLEALRSGRYAQTARTLRRQDEGYCCLGVACEVYQQQVGGLDVGVSTGGVYRYDNSTAVLPGKVQDWLGLRRSDGEYNVPDEGHEEDEVKNLTSDNDQGKSFADIADLIESRPFGLFKEAA